VTRLSTPRPERAGTPGTRWETEIVRVEKLDDEGAEPAPPNRATRHALARATRTTRR
jgi:hypothetical protein